MRFRFCGDLDCPDWVLAEISTLSKLSSVKMKMLCDVVARSLCAEVLDDEKANRIAVDAKLDGEALKACLSVVSDILLSSARHGVGAELLGHELQQLGLPKEHTTALCKVYQQYATTITNQLESQVLRLSSLEDVKCQRDETLHVGPWEQPGARLDLKIRDGMAGAVTHHSVSLSPPQLCALLNDMKAAKKVMDSSLNTKTESAK